MSTAKDKNNVDANSYKSPITVPQLIIGLVIGTYFLTVELIELSLAIYATQENKPELYQKYLLFKKDAPIWKWWQMCTLLIVPISAYTVTVDLIQIFTKKATTKRNLMDVIAALQLYSILYTIFTYVMPLETQLIKSAKYDVARQLNFFHWILFGLNIVGWILPIFRYQESKNEKNIYPKKKTE